MSSVVLLEIGAALIVVWSIGFTGGYLITKFKDALNVVIR